MRVDLHNHTTRCNHAEGTIDEYIARAIELGIDIYGFSEHAPMDFDEHYRLSFAEMSLYEADILDAKKRYSDKIEILLGYEVDWLPNHVSERVLKSKVDYLIGSVHFLDKWGFDNPEFIDGYKDRDIDEVWQAYFDTIEDMAKSGLFDIVGHLDLMKIFKFLPTKDIKSMAKGAMRAIKQSNMTIELNSAGLRKPIGEIYPSRGLLELAYEVDIPITFSSDAHKVEQIGYGYDDVLSLAKEVGYTKVVSFRNRDKELVIF